ncbi:MAG TPA: hypothetical protein VHG08_26120 [Longimicrobium sp.]|nr:hypothetical protein [Longimicrobium sp.]
MLDFFVAVAIEAGKGFFGEAGKAGARALFSRPTEPEQVVSNLEPERALYDPIGEAEYAGTAFLHALAQRDHDTAWAWCDPDWPNDPERSQSFHNTFSSAPPATWNIRERYVPADWQDGDDLPWIGLDVLVTFDLLDGTYSTIEGLLWIFPTTDGWRLADITWDSASQQAAANQEASLESVFDELFQIPADEVLEADFTIHEEETAKRVILCTRCPQKLSIPVGVGRIRVKCPACWTQQVIDS